MHENSQDAVSCESHHQDIWEALFPWSQFLVSALTGETSVNTGRLLQWMAQMMNVPSEMEENEKAVWWVSRQSTQQAVNLANNCLHFIKQRETLLRELQTQHYSQGCNCMQTIDKLQKIEELLVLMWMSEHMRLRANKIQSYRMEM